MRWAIILLSILSPGKPDEMGYLLKKIPDVKVLTLDASTANLSSWYLQKPVVLTLAYGRCPGVCNPYLLQVRDRILLQAIAEDNFQMVVLSFDPEDTPAQLSKLAGFKDNTTPSNWTFGVLQKKQSRDSLMAALGFQTQLVGDLYDHNTVLALIGTDGKILQRVEGLPDNAQWNRLFKELTNDFVPVYSLLSDNVWTSCFTFDPASGGMRMNWGLLLILAPSLATVCIIILLQRVTNRQRKRHNQSVIQTSL